MKTHLEMHAFFSATPLHTLHRGKVHIPELNIWKKVCLSSFTLHHFWCSRSVRLHQYHLFFVCFQISTISDMYFGPRACFTPIFLPMAALLSRVRLLANRWPGAEVIAALIVLLLLLLLLVMMLLLLVHQMQWSWHPEGHSANFQCQTVLYFTSSVNQSHCY